MCCVVFGPVLSVIWVQLGSNIHLPQIYTVRIFGSKANTLGYSLLIEPSSQHCVLAFSVEHENSELFEMLDTLF